jgi:flavin-dependent dehydrogenase
VLIERTAAPQDRIGECLPGAARPVLHELDVWTEIEAGPHRWEGGVISVWGRNEAVVQDAFVDPAGAARVLDRAAYEAALRRAAQRRGAELIVGAVAAAARRDGGPGWRIALRDGRIVEADFLVDAGGRAARLARIAGRARLCVADALVCRHIRAAALGEPGRFDAFRRIEAVRDGWWYATTTPSGDRIIAFHTDADFPRARRAATPEGFLAELPPNGPIAGLCARSEWTSARLVAQSARSQWLSQAFGPDWAAVGDAAFAVDPLSSRGLFHAARCGLELGRSIDAGLGGDAGALARYGDLIAGLVAAYRADARAAYASEPRFPDAPFWKRRRAARPG